jgi:hypothetical protein
VRPTQSDRLLAYLANIGPITPMEAWDALGIYRLGARIYDLKKRGLSILVEKVWVRNRFGERCGPVAKYRLVNPASNAHA